MALESALARHNSGRLANWRKALMLARSQRFGNGYDDIFWDYFDIDC